jgi:hypothetical protein
MAEHEIMVLRQISLIELIFVEFGKKGPPAMS